MHAFTVFLYSAWGQRSLIQRENTVAKWYT